MRAFNVSTNEYKWRKIVVVCMDFWRGNYCPHLSIFLGWTCHQMIFLVSTLKKYFTCLLAFCVVLPIELLSNFNFFICEAKVQIRIVSTLLKGRIFSLHVSEWVREIDSDIHTQKIVIYILNILPIFTTHKHCIFYALFWNLFHHSRVMKDIILVVYTYIMLIFMFLYTLILESFPYLFHFLT